MKHARKRAPTNRINFDYIYVCRLMFGLSATVTSSLIVRGTIVVATALVLAISATIVGCDVRRSVRSGVGLHVGCYVRLCVGSRVGIVAYTNVHVGTSANFDRNRGMRMVTVAETVSIVITPLAHLTIVQDLVQIAGILIVPMINDIFEVDTVGIAIATGCPLEIQIEEFRLLTCCKIKRHSHIAGHTLCLDGHSPTTTTDGYFDSRCGVCGCGRCCIDGKDCRHCYC